MNLEANTLNDFIKLTKKVDGESAYDLGFVLTQIINKIGEDKFIILTKELNQNEKQLIKSFIEVGLQYGDNNNDGKMDGERIVNIYGKLNTIF